MIAVAQKIKKRKIAKAIDEIHNILQKYFCKDTLTQTFTLKLLYDALADQIGLERIILPNKVTKKDMFLDSEKIQFCMKVIEGMIKSDINIILFRDADEVWMQYYMGLFLGKDTIIFALEEEKHNIIHRLKVGGLIKDIIFMKNFSSEESQKLMLKTLDKYANVEKRKK